MNRITSAFVVALAALSFSDLVAADYCNKTTTPICGAGGSGKTLVVESIQKFCIFLPPLPTLTVLESEGCCGTCDRLKTNQCASVATDAVVHCTDPSIAPGARQLPAGLIASAHLVKAADGSKIQITGTLNNVYIMSNDDGGQYDHTNTGQYEVNSPPGGGVSGYDEYVNLVGTGVFCIQLCKGSYTCNSDNDYTGCLVAIPGDYGPGFTEATVPTIQKQNSPPAGNVSAIPSPLVGAPTNYVGTVTTVSAPAGQGATVSATAVVTSATAIATTGAAQTAAQTTSKPSTTSSPSAAGHAASSPIVAFAFSAAIVLVSGLVGIAALL